MSNRPQTGNFQISSANEIEVSKAMQIKNTVGSAVGQSVQVENMPDRIPTPPTREMGVVCRDRDSGQSSTQKYLTLVRQSTVKKVTTNESKDAVIMDINKSLTPLQNAGLYGLFHDWFVE